MKKKTKRNIITLFGVILSSIMLAFVTGTFVRPAHLLSGGFMGVAILIDMVGELVGITIPTSLALVCLNIPVAMLCYKKISPRFTFFSLLHVLLTSFFLMILPAYPLFGEQLLNVVFGGFLNGIAISLALKVNASSGGTDFIALYVANKNGNEIWTQVFCFNTIILCVFGFLFGFDKAGYSILFQFISTKTISNFHNRYKRVMLQIFTKERDQVRDVYIENFHHGLTVLDGIGGYSKIPVSMMTAIVSSYEVDDVIRKLKKADPNVIINVTRSDKYIGRFYLEPLE